MKTADQLIKNIKVLIKAHMVGLITKDDIITVLVREIEEQTGEKLL